jgi:hypothetical protein
MDSGILAALQTRRPLPFYAIKIVAGGTTLRLLDGPGTLTLGGETYTWKDATYGVCVLPDDISEGARGESASVSFSILPPSDSAARTLLSALSESATVKIWAIGAVNASTGASIADPDTEFTGFVDVPSFTCGPGICRLDVLAAGAMAYFLDRGDGLTMSDASHQSVRSGELGFEMMTDVGKPIDQAATPPGGAFSTVNRFFQGLTSARQARGLAA